MPRRPDTFDRKLAAYRKAHPMTTDTTGDETRAATDASSHRKPFSQMPIAAPAWAWLAYLLGMPAMGVLLAGLNGLWVAIIACCFSFQFWTFACWCGVYAKQPKASERPGVERG